MTAAWPAIPGPLNPAAIAERDPVIRARPPIGLQAFRRRQTQAGATASLSFLFDAAEFAAFQAFWDGLHDGTGWFSAPWLATLGFPHHQARFAGPFQADVASHNPPLFKVAAAAELRDAGDAVGGLPYPWRDPWYVDPSAPPPKHSAGSYAAQVMADAPLAYWKGNDSAAGLADSSGNGRHLSGSCVHRCSTLVWEQSDFSSWFAPPGVSFAADFVPKGAGAALTLEAWVKPYRVVTGAPAAYAVLSKDSAWTFGARHADGLATATFYNQAGQASEATGGVTACLDLDAPVHLVATIDTADDGRARLYVNGALEATAAGGIANIASYVVMPKLMSLYGYAGHVAIYGHALAAARVEAHYLAGRP